MPEVLILCDHRPGRSPSQRYRFEQYLPYLEKKGFTFTWSFLLDAKDDKIFYSEGNALNKMLIILKSLRKRKKESKNYKDYDIIFIQREAHFLGTSEFEKKTFLSGAKVIFDFDDSIWMEDTSPGNKKWAWLKKPAKFFDNVSYAHLVIAGNEYLAEKAADMNKNVVIIPTTLDTEIHVPKPELRNQSEIIIGWSGSISTIRHFEMLLPVLKKLKDKYKEKLKIKIIGQKKYENSSLQAECVEWSESTEVNELNRFDIGIMPLPDDEWARGKCGLKGLSYMACGIPAVMSDVGVNAQIIENGVNGFLAKNENEWMDILTKLIEDSGLRKKIGEEGRKTVIGKYSVLANRDKYLNAFNQVLKM
jgi:glycosyltransferase involved in cell wall biosynthesis